ncbi:MAG: hypothetical protein KR126chlam3_00177 [Chlamydiae bacterium]|nr:hypothetical protein [Chlamydiota bacterium]
MLLSFGNPKLFSFSKPKVFDVLDPFLFLYFFTLHADQLNLTLHSYTIRFNNLLALFLILALLLRFKEKLISFDRKLVLGLLAVACSLFISFYYSPYRSRCFYFCGWFGLTILCYFVLPYLLLLHLNTRKIIKLYLFSFMLVGLYGCAQLLFSFIGFLDPFCGQFIVMGKIVRPNAFTYEPSYYALYMTPFVIMANLHYLLRKGHDFFIFKSLNLSHLLLINFFYFVSCSTGALFAFIIFFCLLLALRIGSLKKKVLKYASLFSLSSILLALLLPAFSKTYFLKFFTLKFFLHHSFHERWCQIYNCFKIFIHHPLKGVGLGGVPVYLSERCVNGDPGYMFTLVQERAALSATNPVKYFEPSNITTEIIASLGLLGILAFSYLIGYFVRSARQALRSKNLNQTQKHWILLFFISTLVTLMVWQFSQGLFRIYIWTHLGLFFAFLKKETEVQNISIE